MKNKKSIIALISVLSIITIALIILFIIFLTNGNTLKKYFKFGIKTNSKIICNEKYKLNNIDITTNNSDIEFKYSEDENIKVVVYGEEKENLKVEENLESISIDFKEENTHFFGIDLTTNKIEVYIPRTFDKNINIKSDLGDVKSVDLKNSHIKIDADCGDVKLKKVKSVDVTSKLGDIEIEQISEYLNLDVDCGDIEIDNIILTKNSKIESNLGNIEIDKTNDIYIEAKTDLGDVDVKHSNRYSEVELDVYADCGDIKIN